jgi:DNA-binding transcriptional MocR family regulator
LNEHAIMEAKFDSTADTVAASLREMITNGELQGGERLVERDLADRFGISRIPMREAIQQLARHLQKPRRSRAHADGGRREGDLRLADAA